MTKDLNIRTPTTVTISVVVATILVAGVLLVLPYNHAVGAVKVGDTESKTVQKANNSQHCGFGAGSTDDTCTNTPTNTQSQTTNSGSTGSG